MTTTLSANEVRKTLDSLEAGQEAFAKRYPGDGAKRQPVHTVYGGGHLFKADTAVKLGRLAKKSLAEHAPDAHTFASAIGLPEAAAGIVYERTLAKLDREPVEDYRIDFEDGYGSRPDAEEDGHVELAAAELAKGAKAGSLPPFVGVRVKPFTRELAALSLRTLDLFLTTLATEMGGGLPPGFVVTFPQGPVSGAAPGVRRCARRVGGTVGSPHRADRDHGRADADDLRCGRPKHAAALA